MDKIIKLAGHLDGDAMRQSQLSAFEHLMVHVLHSAKKNGVQPRGRLTMQGFTSWSTNEVCIRWQLEPDVEPCPMCGLPMHWRPNDGVWGCSWCIDGQVDICDSRTTCAYCTHPHASHMHDNPRRLCRECMCTGYQPSRTRGKSMEQPADPRLGEAALALVGAIGQLNDLDLSTTDGAQALAASMTTVTRAERALLKALVRRLAGCNPVAATEPEYGVHVCLLCSEPRDEGIYISAAEVVHHEDCPWRQAVQLQELLDRLAGDELPAGSS